MSVVELRRPPRQRLDAPSKPCDCCPLGECRLREFARQSGTMARRELGRGDYLTDRSTNGCRFWTVKRGTGAISRVLRDGRRQLVSIETTGSVVSGTMATDDNESSLEALTDCEICDIHFSPTARELHEDPQFVRLRGDLIEKRVQRSAVHLSVLGRLDSHERVIFFLASMAAKAGRSGQLVSLPMSREDIADYLGLNTDSVSRILTHLRKTGLVRFHSPTEYSLSDWSSIKRRLPISVEAVEQHFL